MIEERDENADIATCPKGHGWLNLDGSCEVCEPFDIEHIAKLKKDFDYAIRWRRGAEIEMPNPTDLGILLDEVSNVLSKIVQTGKDT